MKQHEFCGKDQCVHCHGTSSTNSKCIERRQWCDEIIASWLHGEVPCTHSDDGFDEPCDCPACHYTFERED